MKKIKVNSKVLLIIGLAIFAISIALMFFLGENIIWLNVLMRIGIAITVFACVMLIRNRKK